MNRQMTIAEWAKFNKMSNEELERAVLSAAAVIGNQRLQESNAPQKTYQFDNDGELILVTIHKRDK